MSENIINIINYLKRKVKTNNDNITFKNLVLDISSISIKYWYLIKFFKTFDIFYLNLITLFS